jgi:hypothetical protein
MKGKGGKKSPIMNINDEWKVVTLSRSNIRFLTFTFHVNLALLPFFLNYNPLLIIQCSILKPLALRLLPLTLLTFT